MKQYAMVFLLKDNIERIQGFRKLYDLKFNLVGPHLTIVFPFPFNLDEQKLIATLIEKIKDLNPFAIKIQGTSFDNKSKLLYLLVSDGRTKLKELHDRLYEGLLEEHLNKEIPFIPHITVGVFDSQEKASVALKDLSTVELHAMVDRLVLLKIEDSIVVVAKEFIL